jgi:hypothetical protein
MAIICKSSSRVPCPVHGCHSHRKRDQVMCPRHWCEVPGELRERIWSLYRTAAGSAEHLAAIREAIDFVNEQSLVSAPPAA